VKVLIVRRGTGAVDGMTLKRYVPGEVYDVSDTMANYLVLEGIALPEMRKSTRAVRVKKKPDRRK
jgi:hypothetical protein